MAPTPTWDPAQYLRFVDHRSRPALELLARVPHGSPRRVVDLGCGAGNVTRRLAERWPEAEVVGLDRSAAMLERARAEPSRIRWIEGDIATWRPDEAPDVIYANASLQWVEPHDGLLVRLLGELAPGGVLAVQMPRSHGQASHELMRAVLADNDLGTPELRALMDRCPVASALHYHGLLAPHASPLDVWETEYVHELQGDDPILDWVAGTGLRPLLEGLDDRQRSVFLTDYRERLRAAYPRAANGRTPFPFRRVFLVAQR
jgi:trans-aconitate 2-methyltransferase